MINILKFGNKFNIAKNIVSIICNLLIFCLPYAIGFNFLAYINPMFIFLFTAFWLPICAINQNKIKQLINKKYIDKFFIIVKSLTRNIENKKLTKEDINNIVIFLMNYK